MFVIDSFTIDYIYFYVYQISRCMITIWAFVPRHPGAYLNIITNSVLYSTDFVGMPAARSASSVH